MDSYNSYISKYRDCIFGREGRAYLMGLSILLIVLLHFFCWFKGTRPWWIYFFSEGQIGVDVFIFLSAYGLEASLRNNGWKKFYFNRIKRIFPVYLLFLITLFLFFQNDIPLIRIIIQSLGQLSGLSLFQDSDFFSTGFEFDWFTPALIFIYASFPIISFVFNKVLCYSPKYEYCILIMLVIISLFALRFIKLPIEFLLYRLPIIMMGVITYIHLEKGEINRLLTTYLLFFITGLLSNQHWFLVSSIVPIVLTAYAITNNCRPLKKIICILGHHSYEIYLAHIFPITNFFMARVYNNIYTFIFETIAWTLIVATIYSLYQKFAQKTISQITNH